MTKEQSEAEKAAEEWTETREGLVELPYSRKTICTAMVKEQIAAFLAGAAWAAPKWVRCSDDLPGDEEVLIVWKGVVCTGWYMEAGEEMGAYWDISGRAMPVTNLEEVTHWMSKPAAPEVDKPKPAREWWQVRYKQRPHVLYCTVDTREEAESIVREDSNGAFKQFEIVHVREVV